MSIYIQKYKFVKIALPDLQEVEKREELASKLLSFQVSLSRYAESLQEEEITS